MRRRTSINNELKDIDVVILAGGLGTRLRKVIASYPKSMAEVAGRPFLDILIDYVSGFGLNRFILCTGYKSEVILDYYLKSIRKQEILFSNEGELLGTGGAVKNAEQLLKSNTLLVMNGDSFCPIDLSGFFEFHKAKGADASIVVVESEYSDDFGIVKLDREQKVTVFSEKDGKGKAFVNGGIYLFQREVLSSMPDGNFSLEYDLFPRLVGGGFYGFITLEKLIDIGTPERYSDAKSSIKKRLED